MNNEDKIVFIYGLFDPREPEHIRYIGKTNKNRLYSRMFMHKKTVKYENDNNNHRINWMKKLHNANIEFQYIILEECFSYNWKEKEQYWIKKSKEEGHILTNSTAGGDGCVEPTPELRKKLSESHRGNKARLGIPCTKEYKEKLSKLYKGRPGTEAERQRMIEYNKKKGKGYKLSEEHKQKIRESCKGRIMSKEEIQHIKNRAPKFDFNGELLSLTEAANKYNVGRTTLSRRIYQYKSPTSVAILSSAEYKLYKKTLKINKTEE